VEEAKVAAALAAMTLEERAGQLVMVPITPGDSAAQVAETVRKRSIGTVLFLGNGWNSATQVSGAAEQLRQAAGSVQLWLAADQEGGVVQRLSGEGFSAIPSAVEQGRMNVDDLSASAARWGRQLAAAGVNLNLAPVVDTVDASARASNAPIGALSRDFGLDASGNAAHARAFVEGMAAGGVGSAVKHFPGLGRITGNTDFDTEGVVDETTTTDDPAVEAFGDVLSADPTMVMVAVATYAQIDPTTPAAFSSTVISDLLRGQLGWNGVVVSDSLTAAAVSHIPAADRAVRLLEAGGDLACLGSLADAEAALDGIVAQAGKDAKFAALVDAAATRVLTAKLRAGLL
jgi:beta-N-acetylhexosaminidase